MRRFYRVLILLILAIGGVSCSSTYYLKQGELLYVGGKILIEDEFISNNQKNELKETLGKQMRPKPNSTFLGYRPKLFFYNFAGETKNNKGIRYWIKTKMGQPPVLFDKVDLDHISSNMEYSSQNMGYLNAIVTSDTIVKNKKVKAVYTVKPKKPFLIRDIVFATDSTELNQEIYKTKQHSLIKVGEAFNLDVIKKERIRIDSYLKEKGYYFFNPDNIIVQVDSTIAKNEVSLNLKVKDDIPIVATHPYTIDNIVVFGDYSINKTSPSEIDFDIAKTHNDYIIIDPNNRFRPQIYDRALYFKKGDLYNRTNHNLALNRLVNLGVFKFVKNQFVVSDSVNNKLNAFYYLTPEQTKSIRFELLTKTNSAAYAGSEINLNWRNRNFFKGAELFISSIYGGMDFQMSAKNKGFNMYKVGADINLIFPKIISPFTINSSNNYVPRTRVGLGYEYQKRTKLYALHSLKGSFGYLWKQRATTDHEFNLLEVNYVSPDRVSDLYMQQIADNPSLKKVLNKQLIFGPIYSYTFTNTMLSDKVHTFYYKGTLDLSANLTGLIMGASEKDNNQKTILGVPFSQYVKINNDFRYYLRLNKNSQFASRIITGIGAAYGNSQLMPSTKQFFVGGTNSVRAFRSRSVGPGSFNTSETTYGFMPDQLGDIVLEMNLEYRSKLFSIVHGAVFLDAGNIWLLHDVADRPGGKISKDFYKEIGIGAGFGLRFDLSFLILRTDFAFPLRETYLPENERWLINKVNLGSKKWLKDNITFNLAIGYPF